MAPRKKPYKETRPNCKYCGSLNVEQIGTSKNTFHPHYCRDCGRQFHWSPVEKRH